MKSIDTTVLIAISALSTSAIGQNQPISAAPDHCVAYQDDAAARLACYDEWATRHLTRQAAAASDGVPDPSRQASKPGQVDTNAPQPYLITMEAPARHDCKSSTFSEISRFWELEAGSDCGTFVIRGYKPISLSVIGSDSVNTQPESPVADHTASTAQPFNTTETRIQLSVRTKIAQGLLTQGQPLRRDSLWFGYSQQSNWQLFSGDLSRPFRTTDHEPELIYVYPTDVALPGGWRLRYGGLSLNHQSNGQALPLSRSWNRTILMAGLENGSQFQLHGKFWQRMSEDSNDDDNPDISDLVGRAEFTGIWNINKGHALGLTLRHSLRATVNGSMKLEWLHKLGANGQESSPSSLRLHTQLFSGYGDSMIDYNRRRTVLSVGLSLVDW